MEVIKLTRRPADTPVRYIEEIRSEDKGILIVEGLKGILGKITYYDGSWIFNNTLDDDSGINLESGCSLEDLLDTLHNKFGKIELNYIPCIS